MLGDDGDDGRYHDLHIDLLTFRLVIDVDLLVP